jgi:hypothetical protein
MKQVNPSKRLDHLQRAREHFVHFLTQCHCYHVAEFQLPQTKTNSAENNTASSSMAYPNLVAMASQRQAKIERWVNGCNLRAVVGGACVCVVCVCVCVCVYYRIVYFIFLVLNEHRPW